MLKVFLECSFPKYELFSAILVKSRLQTDRQTQVMYMNPSYNLQGSIKNCLLSAKNMVNALWEKVN